MALTKSTLVLLNALLFVALAGDARADPVDVVTLTIKSATVDGREFGGMWAEIRVGSGLVYSGFTPLSYNATRGTQYVVSVSDYQNNVFRSWDDGSTDYSRQITPSGKAVLVAHYLDASSQKVVTQELPEAQKGVGGGSILPDWLRNAASSWLRGQTSDGEFIADLQRLVDQKILHRSEDVVPKQEGFSNTSCKKGERYVEMVGKYTNGGKPYEIVSLRMVVLDSSGEILASGSGTISNIGAYQSKYFNVVTRHPADFASCEIQVESVLPYLASRN